MHNDHAQLLLLSLSKAAQMLHIGKNTLANLIACGHIGCIMVSSRRKIAFTELQRFIKDNTYYTTTVTEAPVWDEDVSLTNEHPHTDFDSTELFNKLKGDLLNG